MSDVRDDNGQRGNMGPRVGSRGVAYRTRHGNTSTMLVPTTFSSEQVKVDFQEQDAG